MPSVEAIWIGQCADHQDQADLMKHALSLAFVSNDLHQQYHGTPVNSVVYTGSEVYEGILILGSVFANQFVPRGIKEVEKDIFLAEKMRLVGLEFHLYDPRYPTSGTYYDCRKRFSMIFTRSEQPELDGWMVSLAQVSSRSRLAEYSQVVLCPPTLDLRYYLEDRISRLLGWMKHYYLPGLYYWVHQNFAGYERDWKDLPKAREIGAKKFSALLDEFTQEGHDFTEHVNDLRKQEETLQSKIITRPEGEKGQDKK